MPELPDVETFRRYLDATALHDRIEGVGGDTEALLQGVTEKEVGRALAGKSLAGTRRHGKHLFARADGGPWVEMHFGMTGYLLYRRNLDDLPGGARLDLELAGGWHLLFLCPRKLGHLSLVGEPEEFIAREGLGPDALAIDRSEWDGVVRGARGGLKSLLMDQERLAGVGNVYSDEILLRAGLHPRTPAGKLDGEARARLHRALREVLAEAIEARADPAGMPSTFLLPHREEGAPCPRCGGEIERVRVGGRSAYVCPACQGAGE